MLHYITFSEIKIAPNNELFAVDLDIDWKRKNLNAIFLSIKIMITLLSILLYGKW